MAPPSRNPADSKAAPLLLTIDETCDRFRLSRRFLSKAIRDGRLPAARFGRVVRLDVEDLRAFLDAAKGGAR